MIVPALTAGVLCLALILVDARRSPGTPFALARGFVAGAWAIGWLAYGVNATGFPQPSAQALLVLAAGCLGSIAMVPGPRAIAATTASDAPIGWRSNAVFWTLLGIGLFVVTWDVAWIGQRFAAYGWAMGLKIHRLDRMTMTGGFWLPGFQVMRAATVAAGAVGFGHWLRTRRPRDLVAAIVGLAAAILSTGRWDVVNYGVWLFLIAAFDRHASGFRWYRRQAVFLVATGVFFIAHGQIFGKNEHLTTLADLPEAQRLAAAGIVTLLEPGAKTKSGAGLWPGTVERAPCDRWERALAESNQGFRRLPSTAKALLLYASGPFAAIDRALCEGPGPVRQVITYWPLKIARVLGLRDPETVLIVDAYVDIGLPFNNYSVIYAFVNEIGPILGLIAWVAVALVLRWLVGWLIGQGSIALVAAAMAPISMAIRTPWVNTYFDGTLQVWMLVGVVVWWAARADRAARYRRSPSATM